MYISQKYLPIKDKKPLQTIIVCIFSISFMLIGICINSYADVCDVMRQYGNTVIPVKENRIKMVKEEVKIDGSLDSDPFEGFTQNDKTRAIFTFENTTDKEVKFEMGFPFTKKYAGLNPKIFGNCFTFTTKINGKEVPVVRMKASNNTELKIGAEYDFMYVWPVAFKPKEKKTVECIYKCNRELMYDPICAKSIGLTGSNIHYITKTGALWKGPIGRADFYVSIGNNLSRRLKEGNTRAVIRPKGYKITDNKTIEWHFKNWNPTEDIHVEFYWDLKK